MIARAYRSTLVFFAILNKSRDQLLTAMKKKQAPPPISLERIEGSIFLIRGVKVMLDEHLAVLYGNPGQIAELRDAAHEKLLAHLEEPGVLAGIL